MHRMLPAGCVTVTAGPVCRVHSWWSSCQRLTACWSLGTSPLADTSSADVWPLHTSDVWSGKLQLKEAHLREAARYIRDLVLPPFVIGQGHCMFVVPRVFLTPGFKTSLPLLGKRLAGCGVK